MSKTVPTDRENQNEPQVNPVVAAWLAIALGCLTMLVPVLYANWPGLQIQLAPLAFINEGVAEALWVFSGALMVTAGTAMFFGLHWSRMFFLVAAPVYLIGLFLAGGYLVTLAVGLPICIAIGVIVMLPDSSAFFDSKVNLKDDEKREIYSWLTIFVLIEIAYYGYLNGLAEAAGCWDTPQYSHGYLIPIFAAVLIWLRREPFGDVPSLHRWYGVGLVGLGIMMRLATAGSFYTADRISFLPCLMGIFLMMGGLKTLRWAGPPVAFLAFMFPLPGFVIDRVLRPLQGVATTSSLYVLQTFGVEAYGEGNVIRLNAVDMGVVDQCSGLRMLTIFVALAFAIAMLATTRPWWERLIVILSAVPIALIVNIIRISLTGVLYNLHIKEEIAHTFFHDLGGWIMMPMAFGLLYLEFQVLSWIVVDANQDDATPVGLGMPRQGPAVQKQQK